MSAADDPGVQDIERAIEIGRAAKAQALAVDEQKLAAIAILRAAILEAHDLIKFLSKGVHPARVPDLPKKREVPQQIQRRQKLPKGETWRCKVLEGMPGNFCGDLVDVDPKNPSRRAIAHLRTEHGMPNPTVADVLAHFEGE